MGTTSDWIALCREEAREQGLPEAAVRRLDAFDRDDTSVGVDGFGALLDRCRAEQDGLGQQITARLTGEVDAAQAAMFARRFGSVLTLLARLPGLEGDLLRIGLVRRTTEILAGRSPRALRVRAVVDYVYSEAALVLHGSEPACSLPELVDGISWRPVGPGVRHGRLEGRGPLGPLHVNVLEVRGRRLQAVDGRPSGDLVGLVAQRGALAGVSGGFFLYSEPDIEPPCRRTDPVGLFVVDGEVRQLPVFARGALLQDAHGGLQITRLGLAGCRIRGLGPVVAVNRMTPGITAWTRAGGQSAPVAGAIVVGRQVVGHGRGIPVNGLVLVGLEAPVGTLLEVDLPQPVHTGVAGGPILLAPDGPVRELALEDFTGSAPPITFSQDETYDQNLLPRMAVGLREDASLLFVAVDGRNLERAPGLTLAGTAELLEALGCTVGLNLDGGSSKRMVVGSEVVDLPSTEVVAGSTEQRIRPVHTAILVH